MSHRVVGKTVLDCSLDILKASIIAFKPEWENMIQIDPSGKLETDSRWQGKQSGNYLVIKYTGVDIGFMKDGQGNFILSYDPYETRGDKALDNMEGSILQTVTQIKTIALSQKTGSKILANETTGDGSKRIFLAIPKGLTGSKA